MTPLTIILHLTLEYFLPQHPVKPDQYSFTNNVLVAGNPLEQASENKKLRLASRKTPDF